MFVRLKGNDIAQHPRAHRRAQIDHVLRIAQDKADHRPPGAAVSGKQTREFQRFIDRNHHRLFGEHLHPCL